MAQYPLSGFLKAMRVARAQQRVQQDVVPLGVASASILTRLRVGPLEKEILLAAAVAALTRLPSSSIFPKRSWGSEPTAAGFGSGEFMSMLVLGTASAGEFVVTLLGAAAMASRFRAGRSQRSRASIFQFLHIGETFTAGTLPSLRPNALARRSSSGERDGLHALQPLRFDVSATVDQGRVCAQIPATSTRRLEVTRFPSRPPTTNPPRRPPASQRPDDSPWRSRCPGPRAL